MITLIILSILFYFLSGFLNGIMDTLTFHYGSSKFPQFAGPGYNFWNPAVSWKNKYKDGKPKNGPRFWGSTTIFSWLTDGWHLMKMGMLACNRTSIVLAAFVSTSYPIWVAIIIWVCLIPVFSAGFHLSYSFIFKK